MQKWTTRVCELTGKGETGKVITLLTPEEFRDIPDGTTLYSIFGERVVKGVDEIDDDTRAAYGIEEVANA